MSEYTSAEWQTFFSRQSKEPAPWFSDLLEELEPCLTGICSDTTKILIANSVLANSLFGKYDAKSLLDDAGLIAWEEKVEGALQSRNDGLSSIPGKELPRLVREFAESLELPYFPPVGGIPKEDTGRIGWQKKLTSQGCAVYQWERENKVVLPMDWVPRVKQAGSNSWPEADSVQLPIFFVGRGSDGAVQGLNGWLRLWLWPCEGAQLELLPSVPQRVQPLAHSWVTGLQNACQWMRNQMSPQGGAWKNYALVWDVHTVDFAYDLLLGDSASAAFALAGLWLARQWAPPCWSGLHSVRRADWMKAHITAAIRPCAEAANKAASVADLVPVGGVDVKAPASWVLGQGSAQRQPPLRVALNQIDAEPAVPGQPKPMIKEYASAHDLLQDLAREALNLSEAQTRLLGWLQLHLPAFGPDEHTSSSSPWHLPLLEQPPLAIEDADGWANTLCDIAQDAQPPEHLVPFALTRWALRAHEQHEGGPVHSLFVNLSVSEDFSLEQLLADYERDSRQPTRRFQALQIVGAPGAGKTWLLARFEQACAERLLWQQDRRASQPPPTDAAAVGQDPYPFDDVPLYVALSTLPADTVGDEPITDWFRTQVLGAPVANAPESRLRQRLLYPANESGPRLRLRLMLDGLNDLKVAPGQQRQERARQVVHALWRRLNPGLMMLLGTRTHHRFELDTTLDHNHTFSVATAELQPWSVSQMVGYLRLRWANSPHHALLEKVVNIEAQLCQSEQQRLHEVLNLPLYWRIQCELLEAGAPELYESRAQLLAALLHSELQSEFSGKKVLCDGGQSYSPQDAHGCTTTSDHSKQPSQTRPAFPGKDRLKRALWDLIREMSLLKNQCLPATAHGKAAHWIETFDSESTLLDKGFDLKKVVEQLRSFHYVDTGKVREQCRELSMQDIDGFDKDHQAYKDKYDSTYFVRRSTIEWRIGRMLTGRRWPVLFLMANSGLGKTCLVRNLYDRLENSKHSIPLLIRGLFVDGKDKSKSVLDIIRPIAEQVVACGCNTDHDRIDALDYALARVGIRLVVILDGVNEATGVFSEILEDVRNFLRNRVKASQKLGFFTSFRMIVTSRPYALNTWFHNKIDFFATKMLNPFKPKSACPKMTKANTLIELKNFSEKELDEALLLSKLENVDPPTRKILADPLLLGFYRELSNAKVLALPITPLSLINQYWTSQHDQIRKLAKDLGSHPINDYLLTIKGVCQKIIDSRNPQVEVEWNESFKQQILLRSKVLLFEQLPSPSDKKLLIGFRYDRLAQLLVARYAILENPDGTARPAREIINTLVGVTLSTMKEAVFIERDVIRASLIDALIWRMENEASRSTLTFELALDLLDPAHPALAVEDRAMVDSCLLALSEIVYDFFIESAQWYGPRIVDFIKNWLALHRKDKASISARVLRRLVYSLLREDNLGELVAQVDSADNSQVRLKQSRNDLQRQGSIELINDASGDSAVLLHALHQAGKVGKSLRILRKAVILISKSKLTLWTPSGVSGLQNVGLALLLIASDSIKDKHFLRSIKQLLRRLPSSSMAIMASLLADVALKGNIMPFRMDEWFEVMNVKDQFRAAAKLLSQEGWTDTDTGTADHMSIEEIRRLSGMARNGVITQLLSSALSSRILLTNDINKKQLLAELEQAVGDMCVTAQAFSESSIEDDTVCELGTYAYLLSLVCYHLVVFDAPSGLESEGRPFLARGSAITVFNCMYLLADKVLLRRPFLGQFCLRPEYGRRETSNIVGTLGRAALEIGESEIFLDLMKSKANEFATYDSFSDFLFDSLATLGTLTPNPEFALACIYETARKLDTPGFANEIPANEGDFGRKDLDRTMKAFLKVRAVHPYAVEQYIMNNQDKPQAAPILRHLRKTEPLELNRHLSWTFEKCIVRIIADYPDVVNFVRDSTFENLHPRGLRVLAAHSILRLKYWAQTNNGSGSDDTLVAYKKQRTFARIAGFLGGAGGPIGTVVKWFRRSVK